MMNHTKLLTVVVGEIYDIINESAKQGKNSFIDVEKLAKEKFNQQIDSNFINCVKIHLKRTFNADNYIYECWSIDKIDRIDNGLLIYLLITNKE